MAEQGVHLLREAAPYIYQHRDATFVLAFPGEVAELANFPQLLQDIAIVSALGSRLVLVHGTRAQINQRLAQAGRHSAFHQGVRITSAADMMLVEEAVGCLRIRIEKQLGYALQQASFSGKDVNVCSGNYLTAQPLGIIDGIDHQHTGKVRRVDVAAIQQQLAHSIVLVSPLGYSPSGEAYNLDYQEVTLAVAKALASVDKIILLSETASGLPNALLTGQVEQDAAAPAFLKRLAGLMHDSHIERLHLLDASQDGALLLELYTRDGAGTLVASEQFEQLRPATVEDISGILALIRPLEENGVLIRRSREQLEREIGQFHVLTRDRTIIGCFALYATTDPSTAELACLVVHPQYRGNQRGDKLLRHSEQLALGQGKARLLVLTTQTTDWFRERGFVKSTVDALPSNKKQLYNYQRNSNVLFKDLQP